MRWEIRPWHESAGEIGGIILFSEVITERKLAGDQVRMLSGRLLQVQEDERRRLARELHDELGQSLTAVKLGLWTLPRDVGETTGAPQVEETIGLVDKILQQVRDLSLDLRPSLLDDLGLIPALRWYLERQAERAGLVVAVVDKLGEERLAPGIETACFRLAQEAVTNVVRHARATSVTVEVTLRGGEVELVVGDDGQGFDVAAARERARRGESLGLLGMEERVHLAGGAFTVESSPGRGTVVGARFPLAPEPLAHDPERRERQP